MNNHVTTACMKCSGATLIMTKHAPRHHVDYSYVYKCINNANSIGGSSLGKRKHVDNVCSRHVDSLSVIDLRQAHLALAALEAELVEDVASRLHPLGGIHRLGADGALFCLWWLKHTNAHR